MNELAHIMKLAGLKDAKQIADNNQINENLGPEMTIMVGNTGSQQAFAPKKVYST